MEFRIQSLRREGEGVRKLLPGALITYPNRGFKGSVFDVKIDPDLVARVQRAHAFLNMGEASTERLMVRGCDRQFVFTF
jgi:hypothetical protein